MTADELRAKFETKFPVPEGVHWDGDHYTGTKNIVGSFSNATIWNDTYRGFALGFQAGAEWLTAEMLK